MIKGTMKKMTEGMNQYEMKETLKIADKASLDIETYLKSMPETISVINVEGDRFFQEIDVDLLWIYKFKGNVMTKKIEVKGDTYSKSGNFFIETDSNIEKGTPGCFMYSKADYIFYYFIDTGEVNMMHMDKSRAWFVENMDRFTERNVSTKVNNNGAYYTSAGRLVPKHIMRKELKMKYKVIPEVHRKGTLLN